MTDIIYYTCEEFIKNYKKHIGKTVIINEHSFIILKPSMRDPDIFLGSKQENTFFRYVRSLSFIKKDYYFSTSCKESLEHLEQLGLYYISWVNTKLESNEFDIQEAIFTVILNDNSGNHNNSIDDKSLEKILYHLNLKIIN